MTQATILATGLMFLVVSGVSASDEWPQFRGLRAGVAADDPALPDTWSETENVVWKVDIPGLGWSSPVVWGDHVFITTAISEGEEPQPVKGLYDPGDLHGKRDAVAAQRWMVYDIDLQTGRVRWEQELRSAVPTIKRHIKASFASETPVTDGKRVYVYFGSIGLIAALDMTGKTAGRRRSVRSTAVRSSPQLPRRSSTRTVCTSSTTTRPSRFSSRSTPRLATGCGEWFGTKPRTGRRRSCGRTSYAPRS